MGLLIFTEGAHFVIVPTTLRKLYGEAASSIYGLIFTYTGLANLLIMIIVKSDFGRNYVQVFGLSAILSAIAFVILVTCFKEEN